MPSTAAPSPGKFVEAYQAAFDAGADQILCLSISSEMSAVYTAARSAVEMTPGLSIYTGAGLVGLVLVTKM